MSSHSPSVNTFPDQPEPDPLFPLADDSEPTKWEDSRLQIAVYRAILLGQRAMIGMVSDGRIGPFVNAYVGPNMSEQDRADIISVCESWRAELYK